MKRFVTWLAMFAIVVGGGIATFWPVDFFRLYDANQQPLVMTELEAYCVAFVGIQRNWKEHEPEIPKCMVRLEGLKDDIEHDIGPVPGYMCDGVIAGGFKGGVNLCIDILETNNLWMITTGGMTFQWNDAHPRPKAEALSDFDTGTVRENRSEGIIPSDYGVDEDEDPDTEEGEDE